MCTVKRKKIDQCNVRNNYVQRVLDRYKIMNVKRKNSKLEAVIQLISLKFQSSKILEIVTLKTDFDTAIFVSFSFSKSIFTITADCT